MWVLRPLAPKETDHEAIFAAAIGGAVLMVLAWLSLALPVPACAMKFAAGIPCATCGTTRALHALMEGDALRAFVLNPLAVVLLLAGSVWFTYAVVAVIFRTRRVRLIRYAKWWARAFAALVLLNWTYLILAGR